VNPHNKLVPTCHPRSVSIAVAEYPLNPHESFRAEIVTTGNRSVVRISRWKSTLQGHRRTGQVFEFGAHRSAGVAKLLHDVQDVLKGIDIGGGAV
jgi:hypothetical protein